MNKVIFHIDFDSYFVSAHRSIDSSLINKPVAIGRKFKRSIASSVSYELKNKGIKAGYPNYKILAIEPKTIFVNPDFALYTRISSQIFEYLFTNISNKIEIYSIDECWIDVSNLAKKNDPLELARKIQRNIKNLFKIPISIGISYNKFFAKMATSLAKPYGVLLIDYNNFRKLIWPLSINKYFGIGKSSLPKILNLNIKTIGDLANFSSTNSYLYDIFKSRTRLIIDQANGNGSDVILSDNNHPKSLGVDLTFMGDDIDDYEQLVNILKEQVREICNKAFLRGLVSDVVAINLRDKNKKWNGVQKKLKVYSNEFNFIFNNVIKLFDSKWNKKALRGIGVKLMNVKDEEFVAITSPIINDESDSNYNNFSFSISKEKKQKRNEINSLIDLVNKVTKNNSTMRADKYEKQSKTFLHQTKFINQDFIKKG
ncbi:Y-family DNA polymerase [Mycoplasmopsis meleagridis]|uniref:Y-family DNA polymerase n=1 Tax=Mycoplasmopsis meleagridis TaxID=29561 RepID=UPI003A8555C9